MRLKPALEISAELQIAIKYEIAIGDTHFFGACLLRLGPDLFAGLRSTLDG